MSGPLCGIVPPLITPLCEGPRLDVPALRHVITHVLKGGVHGVFLLGSTGEFASLAMDVRRAVIDEGCSEIAGRVPVIVNASNTCLAESLALAQHAARAGASAVAICPLYYFPLDQCELLCYVRRFSERVTLPVWLYNIPQYARTRFGVDTVRSLLDLPNVVGLKDSSGAIRYIRSIRRLASHRPHFSLLTGNEKALVPAMDAGARGGVCGGANAFPNLFVRLYEAATDNRRTEAELLQSLIQRIARELYVVGPDHSRSLRGLKYLVSTLGVCSDAMAEPFEPFTQVEKARLSQPLKKLMHFINKAGFNLETRGIDA